MMSTPRFDPIAIAERARGARGSFPDEQDLPKFGPAGLVQAATVTISAVAEAWLVGEENDLTVALERGLRWAETAIAEGLAYGGDALLFSVGLKRARAVGMWMRRDVLDRGAWHEAGEASAALWRRERDDRPLLSPLYDVLIDLALAGEAEAALALGESVEPDPASRAILAILACTDAAQRARYVYDFLSQWLPQWLGYLPSPNIAAVLAFGFGDQPWALSSASIPNLVYSVVPSLPVPPRFKGGATASIGFPLPTDPARSFRKLGLLLAALGLARDPDAEVQPLLPHFASWTRHPALDLEVDWHAPEPGTAWIEIRGEGAERLARAFGDALEGKVAPDPQAALAELLTVPPTIRSTANGHVRWEILTTTLSAMPAADRTTILPLVAAGLADTDWRVRMVAIWGVGVLELESLATAAARAPLPPLEEAGLNADDRRTLLALRDAAVLKAGGRQPQAVTREGSGPGGARRVAFVQRIVALLGPLPIVPHDRHAALIAAVLRQPGLDEKAIPRAWRSWIGSG
ncbi:HEAT repeat domain-containing protein [Sphingomonas sp. Root241]|uniref:HEAT repeat domain-containing protein n=1 Tax=Sphingomonas sp. Root241 TaxID=1736501 RepID=UPI000AFA0DCA|nr:HEAT repeat domain-containing protein [Sphingomonas sp. Root241]